MVLDPHALRAPKTALHAVVAVVLALVVSAAAPLSGGTGENISTGIRLVECTDGGALVASHFDGHRTAEPRSSILHPCGTSATQLIRAIERAQWRTALPPPAVA
ncbi:MAG: hypothetical protein JNK53_03835 [Phycisphaerae bacterium]|nr:hypothetical protein [Phycisphaerae bacterium]